MEERIIMVSQLEKEFESIVDKKNEPQNEKKPLLIIDDNPEVIEALRVVLNKDYKLLICYSYEEVRNQSSSPGYKNGLQRRNRNIFITKKSISKFKNHLSFCLCG